MNKLSNHLKQLRLTLLFTFIVFLIMLVTLAAVFICMHILIHFDLLPGRKIDKLPILLFSLVSLGVGTILSLFFSTKPLKPIREIMTATDRIASGDYSVRLNLEGPEEFRMLNNKFNHMAEELESVEVLRTDFVNNFSHEFKTPIVSIRGFAKALKWDNLTDEERSEYLDIIINESERLSALSLNVLYFSKIENQMILTNRTRYNLSEQIRLVVVLLDYKLAEKGIEISFDSEEFFITACEEMMQQVWINLLDNAIKFSPVKGIIEITITPSSSGISVKISDQGIGMSDDVIEHVFDKFYQGDRSHSTSGNGLGLSIVKKIVELHHGEVIVSSNENGSTFEVKL